jgi:hypothetical protein
LLALAGPLSDDEQVTIVEQVAEALIKGKESPNVRRHFHRDAVFSGDKDYPWSFAGFHQLLQSRDCAPRNMVWSADRLARHLALLHGGNSAAQQVNGPGLTLYCVSAKRVAAHEIYGFDLRDRTIVRVYFALKDEVPAPSSASANLEKETD